MVHAAARDEQRPARGAHRADGLVQLTWVGRGPAHAPHPLVEEGVGPVVRLGLHVLRQREGDRARVDRVGEDAHRREGRGDQGLGPGDPVEVPGDGAQAVVDRHVARVGDFELLEHGVGGPGREGVAWQQQDGQVVDGGEGGAGDEVGGAGPDGRGHGLRGEPAALPGEADGRVHHGLFVAALVVGHVVGVLQECLADPGDVPVPEDAPGRVDQAAPLAVALGVLPGQEPHEGLCCGEPRHRYPSVR